MDRVVEHPWAAIAGRPLTRCKPSPSNMQLMVTDADDTEGVGNGDEHGAHVLKWALSSSQAPVTSLDIQGRCEEAATLLFQVLPAYASTSFLTSLRRLVLTDNNLGESAAIRLALVLRNSNMLATLSLCGNHIGDGGAAAVARALAVNRSLKELHLRRNWISDGGASELAWGLAAHPQLLVLGLEDNYICNGGVAELAHALTLPTTALHTLRLSGNYIDEKGASALAQAILINQSLTTLCLDGFRLAEGRADALARALATNFVLTTLILETSEAVHASINGLLCRNRQAPAMLAIIAAGRRAGAPCLPAELWETMFFSWI